MSETYPFPDFLQFVILLTDLVPVDLLTSHSRLSHYFIAIYCILYLVTFCAFLCRFYSILLRCCTLSSPSVFILHFRVFCRILSFISYSVMVGFAHLSLNFILLNFSCYCIG